MQVETNDQLTEARWSTPPAGSRWLSLRSCLVDYVDSLEEFEGREGLIYGLPTGIADLDRMTGGFQAADLIVVAGRPAMLKTTLAMSISDHIAGYEGLPVMYVNLTGQTASLSMRLLSSKINQSTTNIKSRTLDEAGWENLAAALESLQNSELRFIEIQYPTVDKIIEAARSFTNETGKAALVVVDYLQLVNGQYGARYETRSSELSFTTRQLKSLGQELGCPVLLISQLNRAVETRIDKRPILSDLRDCGSIEDDADLILFNYKDSFYNRDSREPNVLEIIVAKNRHGVTGMIKQAYNPKTGRLSPIEQETE